MTWGREDLIQALIAQTPGYVALIEGPELRVTYATEGTAALLGREIVGRSVREAFRGTAVLDMVERVLATGLPQTVSEKPLLLDDASPTRHFTRTYTPLKDRDGNVQAILIQAREVTADVQARERSEQRRRAELDRMVALFDEAPVMLSVLTPPKLTIALANRGLRELFADRVPLGTSLRDAVPPNNRATAIMDRVLATGRAEAFEHTSELPGFLGRVFSISVVPLRDASGAVDSLLIAGVEVTDQRRARTALEAQARDLELARQEGLTAIRAKDQFLAMLGHEIRNPLQPMLSAVQMMYLDGESSLALEMLEREVRHLIRIVDNLLEIGRNQQS